jgi:hypothetical protein
LRLPGGLGPPSEDPPAHVLGAFAFLVCAWALLVWLLCLLARLRSIIPAGREPDA